MRTLLKTLLTLGVATALPFLTRAAGDTCPAGAATCPAGAAKTTCAADGKAGACSAEAKADGCCAADTKTAAKNAACKVGLQQASYKVSGMSGAGCEAKLTKALGTVQGVSEPTACSAGKLAKVSYDPARVKDEQVIAAITKAGFKVEAETIAVKVEGMSCSACSDKVSKKLASVKGVSEQTVCHESKQAVITFDPAKVSRKDVLAAIDTTGFKVTQ